MNKIVNKDCKITMEYQYCSSCNGNNCHYPNLVQKKQIIGCCVYDNLHPENNWDGWSAIYCEHDITNEGIKDKIKEMEGFCCGKCPIFREL